MGLSSCRTSFASVNRSHPGKTPSFGCTRLYPMDSDLGECEAFPATHRLRCILHLRSLSTSCHGSLKRGGICGNKGSSQHPWLMPTCKVHRDQQKEARWCRARLPCGLECGNIYEWKPLSFPLCNLCRSKQTTCYFLQMPPELRTQIYGYILPDRPIPARHGSSRNLRDDGEEVHMDILRVNHQIHDEVVSSSVSG